MVFVFLQGKSIEQLKDYAHLIDPDVNQFATVNRYYVYDDVMDTIGTTFDYIHASCDMITDAKGIVDYLKQSPKTMLITSKDEFDQSYQYLTDVMYQVAIEKMSCGNFRYQGFPKYNSVTALLLVLLRYGHRNFALFGCDGIGDYFIEGRQNNDMDLRIDTNTMNDRFWSEVDFLGVAREEVNIFNVNPDSHVKCFPTTSYHEFFTKGEKHGNIIRDGHAG